MINLVRATFVTGLLLAFFVGLFSFYDARQSRVALFCCTLLFLASLLIWWGAFSFPYLGIEPLALHRPVDSLEYSLVSVVPVVGLIESGRSRFRRWALVVMMPLALLGGASLMDATGLTGLVTGRLYGVGVVPLGPWKGSIPVYEFTDATLPLLASSVLSACATAFLAEGAGDSAQVRRGLACATLLIASMATRDAQWLLAQIATGPGHVELTRPCSWPASIGTVRACGERIG